MKKKTEDSELQALAEIQDAIDLIKGKWTGSVIYHLRGQPVGFNDLVRMLQGASKNIIAQRLKTLEENNFVIRQLISERPLEVTYQLSEKGKRVLALYDELKQLVEGTQGELSSESLEKKR